MSVRVTRCEPGLQNEEHEGESREHGGDRALRSNGARRDQQRRERDRRNERETSEAKEERRSLATPDRTEQHERHYDEAAGEHSHLDASRDEGDERHDA